MASITRTPQSLFEHDPEGRPVPAPPERRREAVARLLGVQSPSDGAVTRFLTNARAEGTDLRNLWVVLDGRGAVLEAAMVLPGTGRTAMVFVAPPAAEEEPDGSAEAVLRRARAVEAAIASVRQGGGKGVNLVQALIEPEQTITARVLREAGLSHLAELAYLRRPLPVRRREPDVAWPDGIRVIEISRLPRHEVRGSLIEALERSYEGTLDCAALCGVRSPEDVLDSHLGVGEHDPSLWLVLFDGSRPAGAALYSPCPEQGTVELVYLGLAPVVRGRGFAKKLLETGVCRLGGRPERTLACAVDLANAPALALYRSAKFRQFAVRSAWIRPLGPSRP